MIEIDTGYRPRKQQEELHLKLRRFSAVACHRRFGKTIFAINHALDFALKCPFPNPQVALVSPLLSQSKRNAWDDLKRLVSCFKNAIIHENDLRVTIPRAEDAIKFQLFGAENPEAIRGYKLDFIILDEAQGLDPNYFSTAIRPMLSDRRGHALFIGTVQGRNFFYKLRERYREKMLSGDQDYFEAEYKASETGIIPQSELDSAREEMGEERYLQEYELSCETPNKGSYYGEYLSVIEKRTPSQITSVPYDNRIPVDCAWDLGMDDQTAIWFYQQLGHEIRVIDYLEDSGKGIPEYSTLLRMKPYGYGTMYLPHDAAVRELGTGKSREEIMRSLRFDVRVVKRQNVADGIQAVRSLLQRCWFDAVKCKKGLDGLKEYSRQWDEKNQTFQQHPKHDWSSHSADGFRCLAMGLKETTMDSRYKQQTAICDYDVLG